MGLQPKPLESQRVKLLLKEKYVFLCVCVQGLPTVHPPTEQIFTVLSTGLTRDSGINGAITTHREFTVM